MESMASAAPPSPSPSSLLDEAPVRVVVAMS
ncbi:hypothetical protein IWX62_000566 [Arthrobacter sp. CAN_A1]